MQFSYICGGNITMPNNREIIFFITVSFLL